jgi:hypothetical protein
MMSGGAPIPPFINFFKATFIDLAMRVPVSECGLEFVSALFERNLRRVTCAGNKTCQRFCDISRNGSGKRNYVLKARARSSGT